jgi:hypothetical protein
MALGDPAGETDVLPGAVVLAVADGLACERLETVDPLCRDAHVPDGSAGR